MQRLRSPGYVEGQNIVIEQRYADGWTAFPGLAAELVRLNVDLIVVGGRHASPAKQGRRSRSIFMLAVGSGAAGLVASLARPGGNFTGLTLS